MILLSKVDDIVLHKVCEYIARWEKAGYPLYHPECDCDQANPYMLVQESGIVIPVIFEQLLYTSVNRLLVLSICSGKTALPVKLEQL